MAIDKFIVGHKYIYLGEKVEGWSSLMEFVLFPQVLTCVSTGALPDSANFNEDKETEMWWHWNRSTLKDWLDVTDMSEKEIQKILANRRGRLVAEKI